MRNGLGGGLEGPGSGERLERLNQRFRALSPRRPAFRPRARIGLRAAGLAWLLLWAAALVGVLYVGSDAAEANPRMVRVRHLAAFPNCDAAREVGLAPAFRGQPGYWPQHDRDKDGWACEPMPRWKR